MLGLSDIALFLAVSVGFAVYKMMQHLNASEASESPRDLERNGDKGVYHINCLKLHEEIRAFYYCIYADGKELRKRMETIFCIRNFIDRALNDRGLKVEYFGSTFTGTYLPTSDIDIVITCRYEMCRKFLIPVDRLKELEELLMKFGSYQWTIEASVTRTGLPLLRVLDTKSLIKLDISCVVEGTDLALRKCQWINQKISEYPDVPKIVVVLKELLKAYKLLDVRARGISSYVLTLLVIFIFQQFSARYSNLGTLLLLFLACFGRVFDHEKQWIIMDDVKSVIVRRKKKHRNLTLIILDPVERDCNPGYASSIGMFSAKQAFGTIFDNLKGQMDWPLGRAQGFLRDIFDSIVFSQ